MNLWILNTSTRFLAIYFHSKPAYPITLQGILDKTAQIFGVAPENIRQKRKDSTILVPRQTAMYIAVEYSGKPIVEIAKFFDKSHSSVIHSCKVIKLLTSKDLTLKNKLDKITADLREGF